MDIQLFLEETVSNLVSHNSGLLKDKMEHERQLQNLMSHQKERQQDIDDIQSFLQSNALPQSVIDRLQGHIQYIQDGMPTDRIEKIKSLIEHINQELETNETHIQDIQSVIKGV